MSALLTPQTAVVPPVAPLASTSTEKHPETGVVPYRFTVEEYYKLGEIGILSPESRVELIDGLLVCKPMQNPPHHRAVRRLQSLMARLNGPDWTIHSRLPADFEHSSLEPDLAVLRGPETEYDRRQTRGADAALIIEVADTSLAYDSGSKQRQYARAGIPAYWIVNIPDSRVEVHTQPSNDVYQTRTDFVAGQSVPVVLDGVTVAELAVVDIFG